MVAQAETSGGKLEEYLSVEPASQTLFRSVVVVVGQVDRPCGLRSAGRTLPRLSPGEGARHLALMCGVPHLFL